LEVEEMLSRADIPQLDLTRLGFLPRIDELPSSAGQPGGIGAECHTPDGVSVALEIKEVLTGMGIPEFDLPGFA
jgi:hypothetical protein